MAQPSPPRTGPEVRARYEAALQAALERLKADRLVLGVVLCGSLSHDEVWAKSDIDLVVITDDKRDEGGSCTLWEEGVHLHAWLISRGRFARLVQGIGQDSFVASLLSLGRLLYAADPSLTDLMAGVGRLGGHDREIGLLTAACHIFPTLTKAEKWLYAKRDPQYAAFYLLKLVDPLASLEALWHGEVPRREVVSQARSHNPELFADIYDRLLSEPKTYELVEFMLTRIGDHLHTRRQALDPLLEYLAAADGPRSVTQISHHFARQLDLEGVDSALEWLADLGLVQALSLPRRLLPHSRSLVEEAAYVSIDSPCGGAG